jgi:hypothetical protein
MPKHQNMGEIQRTEKKTKYAGHCHLYHSIESTRTTELKLHTTLKTFKAFYYSKPHAYMQVRTVLYPDITGV